MVTCKTLETLKDYFDNRFQLLNTCLAVRGGNYDEKAVEQLTSETISLRTQLNCMSKNISRWRKQVEELKVSIIFFFSLDINFHLQWLNNTYDANTTLIICIL